MTMYTKPEVIANLRRKIKELEDKLKAVKTWFTQAKAQGHISISQGEQLDEILGAEGHSEA